MKRKRATSDLCRATYRVEGGKVVEIWTTPSNDAFVVGPLVNYRLGWWLVLGYVFAWSRLYKPRIDWDERLGAGPSSRIDQ